MLIDMLVSGAAYLISCFKSEYAIRHTHPLYQVWCTTTHALLICYYVSMSPGL
jgi:hypothetical protein